MGLISVNLLPAEFILEQVKKQKFYKIQYIGISVLLLVFFLSSLTISLRVLQSQKNGQIQQQFTELTQRVGTVKAKEDTIVGLKARLATISQYSDKPSTSNILYHFIDQTLSSQVAIDSFAISPNGEISLVLVLGDVGVLDNLIQTLSNKPPDNIHIDQMSVDNIGRSGDNSYRLSLRLKSSQ